MQSLGKNSIDFSGQDPLFNFYTYALNQIGGGTSNFDGEPVENYADTIVMDLFGVESTTAHVPGIEKEAVVIFGLWMRV